MITRSTVPEFHLAAALAAGPEYFVDRFGGPPSKREPSLDTKVKSASKLMCLKSGAENEQGRGGIPAWIGLPLAPNLRKGAALSSASPHHSCW